MNNNITRWRRTVVEREGPSDFGGDERSSTCSRALSVISEHGEHLDTRWSLKCHVHL